MNSETLAARVEALKGPCRETDALVAAAIRWQGDVSLDGILPEYARTIEFEADDRGAVSIYVAGKRLSKRAAPAYTASLDAAMTLVPEGCAFDISHWHPTYGTRANVLPLYQDGNQWLHRGSDPVYRARAATPALALTAASLRARGGE